MARSWVVNASPCILLAKAGRADLLPLLAEPLVFPQSVVNEIEMAAADDPARVWLRENRERFQLAQVVAPELIASWDLGSGENAVLAWAHENAGFEAILDDRAARICANALKIPVRGSMGVVLLAKQEGLVERVRPVIDSMIAHGLRISDSLVAKALQLAGE